MKNNLNHTTHTWIFQIFLRFKIEEWVTARLSLVESSLLVILEEEQLTPC